jgi:hypothetical protein
MKRSGTADQERLGMFKNIGRSEMFMLHTMNCLKRLQNHIQASKTKDQLSIFTVILSFLMRERDRAATVFYYSFQSVTAF